MDDEDRSDLIATLFAVMTADLEDAAALAADGQGRGVARDKILNLAERVRSAAYRTTVVADAIAALLAQPA